MVLTHINRALIYLAAAGLVLAALSAQGHPGGTDAEGCHAGTQPRHCHGRNSLNVLRRRTQGAPARDTGRQFPAKRPRRRSTTSGFARRSTGRRETRHGYTSAGGRSFVKVDCETSTTVYEGGLDKRSSLDSLQQALFFSVLTGKRPAVVIYDTDGKRRTV